MRLMLAATCRDLADLRFPVMASIKLDGIRAVVVDGLLVSRTMKPIRNIEVQKKFRHLEGMDGELILGKPNAPNCYRVTNSAVMSERSPHENGVTFRVFDNVLKPGPFLTRYASIPDTIRHQHWLISKLEDLMAMEERVVAEGHEGVVTRSPQGEYKHGRSTMEEQGMVKVKRFEDDEAKVVGMEELMHNDNEATTNVQGYTERTSHKANKRAGSTLGALICEWNGVRFKIGTGFSASDRDAIWMMREKAIGLRAKFKYLPVGVKTAPRHPVFLGFRLD